MSRDIMLLPATQAHITAIVNLWKAQDLRHYALDPALHTPRLPEAMRAFVHNQIQSGEAAFVALDSEQYVRGYVAPARWDLSATSVLHAFLTPRNGITQAFILPDPREKDAEEVGRTLLNFLSMWWREQQTTGDLLRWPTSDSWLDPLLKAQGFLLDSHCAIRPMTPLEATSYHTPNVTIRLAVQDDEEQLMELFLAEMAIHAETVACSRISDVALKGFQSKLQQLWTRADQEEQLFILVAEQRDGEVVGMAENVLISVASDEAPGFTPPGSYGCLDNVSVKREFQGQGIGRLLVDTALSIFLQKYPGLNKAILWYNPDNPSASRFWPRLGFHDLWTTYQRLRPVVE
jgi:ribosomal protein S18 acetylase RimI-like enzyme